MAVFDYDEAFSRNIGWVSEEEQQILRTKRVALAGMGGVGGVHLMTLCRMGFTKFHISDIDDFELANFNRQIGASVSSVGHAKAETMENMARQVNPDADIKVFPNGVRDDNLEAFLDGVDLFIDGFDFFVLDIRAMVFARCRELGIPCVTAAPIGMGTGYLVFTPDSMSFEDYFRFEGKSREQKYVNFLLGLTPAMLQRQYLKDISRIDLEGGRGPSTVMACQLCAGVAATEGVKLMLGRGKIYPAPYFHHYDPYRETYVRRYLWRGNGNPLQIIKRHLAYRLSAKLSFGSRPAEDKTSEFKRTIERVLDLARWAPSGDNTQPWLFEDIEDERVTVRMDPKTLDNPYEFNYREPAKLAFGALLETIRIAGTRFGQKVVWSLREESGLPVADVSVMPDDHMEENFLSRYIKIRSVDRQPYQLTPLMDAQKKRLQEAVGPAFRITWLEDARARSKVAGVNAIATRIRLLTRKCFDVHQNVIDWENRYPRFGMPAGAVGLDPLTTRAMRWVLGSWTRMKTLGTLGGVLWSQFELDFLPGIFCAAHFSFHLAEDAEFGSELERQIETGAAVQRFWLTATQMELWVQPGLAPLCFAHYGRVGKGFGGGRHEEKLAEKLARRLPLVVGDDAPPLFLGRIGTASRAASRARSLRRAFADLIGPAGQ